MQFGLFHEWPNPDMRDWNTLFEEGVEQIQYSEELGFDFCLLAEHHFSNYGQTPAPLLQAMRVGERTKSIRIGTAAVLLPMWQPIRLAEEIAVLDNFINGRFICGIGRGYHPYEMGGFNINVPDTREMFNESLDILVKAWTPDETFTYHGQHFKVPTPVNVLPKPMQKPHPPIWLAGTSADSMRIAAERGFLPMASALTGDEANRKQLSVYAQALKDAGKPLDNFNLGYDCFVYVAPSDEEALKEVERARWQMQANYALVQKKVVNGAVQATPYEGEMDYDTFVERVFIGSPDTVIKKLQKAANVGATHIISWMMFGGLEHEKLMRSVKLMGEEVIPALNNVSPPSGLLEKLASAT